MDAFASTIPAKLDALWDFDNAADTQRKFETLLNEALVLAGEEENHSASDPDAAVAVGRRFPQVLEVLTQIARAQGLQRAFDDAHATLDRVQRALLNDADAAQSLDRTAVVAQPTRIYVRYLLERGRVFNSSNHATTALSLFHHAWQMAQRCSPSREDDLEIDAAHMVAIAEPSIAKQTEWNRRAITTAETSSDPKARKWIGSLTNNLGWTLHSASQFLEALEMFDKALAYREEAGESKSIGIAKWCKARCLRSLGRLDEALAIQRALVHENETLELPPDGYNFEELGELLLLTGEPDQARGHFQRAVELLSADAWFVEHERERLQRLETLAQGATV